MCPTFVKLLVAPENQDRLQNWTSHNVTGVKLAHWQNVDGHENMQPRELRGRDNSSLREAQLALAARSAAHPAACIAQFFDPGLKITRPPIVRSGTTNSVNPSRYDGVRTSQQPRSGLANRTDASCPFTCTCTCSNSCA